MCPARCIQGEITAPPDKSISHRAVLIGSIAGGRVVVNNFLRAKDCLATLNAMRMLGVAIEESEPGRLEIDGVGLGGLRQPVSTIDCGNSGTTMRLLTGLLAAQNFPSRLTGDQYLRKRPMDRVIHPLRQMGAKLRAQDGDRLAPIDIEGSLLTPIIYDSPIASAQVKSAILLAGLYCTGRTTVREPYKSRDHTERMLHQFGIPIEVEELSASVIGPAALHATEIVVPGDISSASFFIAAAAMLPQSELLLRDVGLNRTRSGFLDVLGQMGVEMSGADTPDDDLNEHSGDVLVRSSDKLKAVRIGPGDIPRLIDEVPLIAVMAVRAEGTTIIEGAGELRVKETDRLSALARNLSALGARIEERLDGLVIAGPQRLRGGKVESFGDHRTAMAMTVAGLIADNPVTINDTPCVTTSFPGFFETIRRLTVER
ncbi:MAG: 3-phosphoshikimate 1-carboxyvinyltransferase [Candidatus Hydrogenedentota bacterium]|nr:MAG: 3-phosphoshikimate 1-carboxyvinyltransferase [Candidatus Hydrogenedentota bacterium]